MSAALDLKFGAPSVPKLRPYQEAAVKALQDLELGGVKRMLLQAGTGSGKTIIAAEIIKLALVGAFQVLFLAHTREIIRQCSDKLRRFGVEHGIIMAGEPRLYHAKVQVASVQTIWSRAIRREVMAMPGADLLIIDECHRCLSSTYQKIIARYPNAVLLGLTATPIRSDGRGLGHVYEKMVRCPSIKELTKLGYLVPVRYYAPSIPDLSGVKVTAGDYNGKHLAEKMDKTPLIGDVVENWARICPDRKTIVFASGVKHSIHLAERFSSVGVKAKHIDGRTRKAERDAILTDLAEGDLQVVSSVGCLTEGWDSPPVSCAILARPTKSVGSYLQMSGRILRSWPGKKDCILIDHSGAIYEHGLLDEFVEWSLDKNGRIQDRVAAMKSSEPRMATCQNCKFVYIPKSDSCPECGHFNVRRGKDVDMRDGDLEEVGTGRKVDRLTKQEWYSQFIWYAWSKDQNSGSAAHKYRAKFGVWPRGLSKTPVTAGPEVLAYIKHLNIRFWKSKARTNGISRHTTV